MIPDHLVRELRYIELRVARRIRSLRVGNYVSPVRGEGFDFEQHRHYRPGDDVRRIDWSATARLGIPFMRQTRTDRELHVVLAGDLSRSMRFGSGDRSKHDALILATASLLFSALEDQVSSGVLGFTDKVLDWTAPISDKHAAWAALTRLWATRTPGKRTLIRPAVQHLLRRLRHTTLVVIVSDFLTDEYLGECPELAMLAARHEVVALVLEDPGETQLPAGEGFVRFRDLESDAEVTVGLSKAVRQRYASSVQQRRLELQHLFYRAGVGCVFVNIQGDVVEPLMRVFGGRKS